MWLVGWLWASAGRGWGRGYGRAWEAWVLVAEQRGVELRGGGCGFGDPLWLLYDMEI